MAPFFDKAVRAAEPYIIQHADRWCELLLGAPGGLCYAKSFDIKEPGKDDPKLIPKSIVEYTAFYYHIARSPFQNVWLWLKPRGLDRLVEMAAPKGARTYMDFTSSCLTQRMAEEEALEGNDLAATDIRKDFFHHLFQAKDPETGGPGYTREKLGEENDLLVIAGADTTSTAFAAMFFYLTRNPRVYRELTEIRTTFKSVEEIHSGPQLSSCRYLRAFIDEALRMNPPVGPDLDREVLAGGIDIEGRFLPLGTEVSVSLYSLHHNEDAFPDAFKFKPERWIPDEKAGITTADIATYSCAFAPFSTGPRGCPGKNLAYLEMSIVMAKILFLADIQAAEGNELGAGNADLMWGRRNKAHFQTKDIFVSSGEGPAVQFRSASV